MRISTRLYVHEMLDGQRRHGGLFLATGSLLAPVTVHVTVNGLNLLSESWRGRLE